MPSKIPDAIESDLKNEEESSLWGTVRGKCITQLLLLGAIDSIQKKYWSKLKAQQKIAIMDILLSVLEFSASYNSYSSLRIRMHYIPAERPLNLLRRELAGTSIYLDILQKTTSSFTTNIENPVERNASVGLDMTSVNGESANVDIHRLLELRSPVIVKTFYCWEVGFGLSLIIARNLRFSHLSQLTREAAEEAVEEQADEVVLGVLLDRLEVLLRETSCDLWREGYCNLVLFHLFTRYDDFDSILHSYHDLVRNGVQSEIFYRGLDVVNGLYIQEMQAQFLDRVIAQSQYWAMWFF
ncbi:hypothetical protein IFM89_039689 [Coptis chinensis]|uniref:Sec7/BIG1-like C-terminal domain-containing protein n=1 Tax=Coptis chinensis TaxID=261450 RepID=A0A835GUQ6_9MAGN|nr:hypothetical protein IFM89_039689 [Coptis chinensis]